MKKTPLEKNPRSAAASPWQLLDIFDDVDDVLWCWESIFKNTISNYIKPRKVKVRSENQPWMTGSIRKEINKRFRLFNKAKLSGKNSLEWKEYKKIRNSCTNLIRRTKAEYWKKEFQKSTNSKTFWKTVKKFNGDTKAAVIGPLSDNSIMLTDNSQKANLMNTFFANVGRNLASKTSSNNTNLHVYRVTPTISNISPNIKTFAKSFTSAVKIDKSCGPDEITAKELLINTEVSISGLYTILKKSIETETFPNKWKTAKVTCVHKKGSKKGMHKL